MTSKSIINPFSKTILAFCLILQTLPAATFGKYTYTDNGPSITITGYVQTEVGAVVIPPTIAGKPVTAIGDGAFYYCVGLTSVTIPASVTSIGESVFYNCSGLTSVTIPIGVTSIGNYAFLGCSGLTSNIIPSSVTSIGDGAFSGCSGLTSVIIPNSVTSIGGNAFGNCSGLTSVIIPSSVTSIKGNAFGNCSDLTAITVESMNPVYSSVNGVVFDLQKTTLTQYPAGKTGSYTIPNSVTAIGVRAFYGCSGLTSVTIPSSVTAMWDYAFSGCSGLTSVTIPNSVTAMGDYAFYGCSGLSVVTIPNRVTSLGRFMFSNCRGLKGVSIGNSVTSIGYNAFSNCYSLAGVTIPNSVTSIGDYAFGWCRGLTQAVFLGNAPSMGSNVFNSSASSFRVFYMKGKIGYTSPTWKGYPAVVATPRITVQQPVGSSLEDGTAKKSFGTVTVGMTGSTKNFTIRNTGLATLSGLAITKTGSNASDFVFSAPAVTRLASGATTTFKVTFKPTATGNRYAAIHIKSNDVDKNPFDISLSGLGVLP